MIRINAAARLSALASLLIVASCAGNLAFAAEPVTAATVVTASPSPVVVVPYGDLITTLLSGLRDTVLAVAGALLVWFSRQLPGFAAEWVKTALANKWLDRAVDFGIHATEGAVAGGTFTVPVGSAVAANALSYFMAHAPTWLKSWLGGHADDIKDRILARIPTEGTLAPAVGGTAAAETVQPATAA